MHNHSHEHNNEDSWWIARPENSNKIFFGLVTACVLLVIFDLVYFKYYPKEGHFDFENITGFHAAYGFIAFIFVVVCGSQLRNYLMRPEDYYDVPYTPRNDEHSHSSHEHHHDKDDTHHAEPTVADVTDSHTEEGGH